MLFKILQNFLHTWNGKVKDFSKMYSLSFFGQFVLHTFLLFDWILRKNFNFCKFINVSFVIFGHQTWDLEGVGQFDPPPPAVLVFKYPSRNRVKPLFCHKPSKDEWDCLIFLKYAEFISLTEFKMFITQIEAQKVLSWIRHVTFLKWRVL